MQEYVRSLLPLIWAALCLLSPCSWATGKRAGLRPVPMETSGIVGAGLMSTSDLCQPCELAGQVEDSTPKSGWLKGADPVF